MTMRTQIISTPIIHFAEHTPHHRFSLTQWLGFCSAFTCDSICIFCLTRFNHFLHPESGGFSLTPVALVQSLLLAHLPVTPLALPPPLIPLSFLPLLC